MSKINVDEIQVGDLIQRYSDSQGKYCVGVFTRLAGNRVYAYWSDFKSVELWCCREAITGHWKVINFEEESKMNDELKVYTGKETIEALLEGKTLQDPMFMYRIAYTIQVSHEKATGWADTDLSMDFFLRNEFTEVVTPQVGDWVRVYTYDKTYVAKITHKEGTKMYADWDNNGVESLYLDSSDHNWEILSPEQVSEYKRELAFSKVGRKLNEFKHGDIVFIDTLGVTSVVITKKNDNEIKLHGINEKGKGYTAKPHQLTPISFVENQVDLS